MPQVGRTRRHKTREKIHPPGRRAYCLTPLTSPKSVNPQLRSVETFSAPLVHSRSVRSGQAGRNSGRSSGGGAAVARLEGKTSQIVGRRETRSTSRQPDTWRTRSAPRNRDGAGRESTARRKPSKRGRQGPRRPPPPELPLVRLFRPSSSSWCRLTTHPETPLPGVPLPVVGSAPAGGQYAKTFRELLLPLQLPGPMGGLSRGIHLEAPLMQGRENPDGLSRALRPRVAVGEGSKPRRLPR